MDDKGAESFLFPTNVTDAFAPGAIATKKFLGRGSAQREEALKTRMTQEKLAATDRSIQAQDKLSTTLSEQTAIGAAKGLSPASGSFNAIKQQSFNNFNADERASAINLSMKESALTQEIFEEKTKQDQALINEGLKVAPIVAGFLL